MRHIIASCIILAIALPCQAQNKLTPKEIADGWILLFDGETTYGWKLKDKARIADGTVVLEGENAEAVHGAAWRSHELHFEYCVENPHNPRLKALLDLRGASKFEMERGEGNWNRARLTHQSDANTQRFESQLILDRHDGTKLMMTIQSNPHPPNAESTIRLAFIGPGGSSLQLRNIKLRPLNTKSLFNGNDLTGWNVFPKKKSQFAVIDNAINVKDGPGDLQTVGKYKDFILQLECKSNGKHLNSGIFFRCRDNEYQNGYEAQIFNKFSKEPTQKYLVEEYDPKNNKLLGKKEVMSTAFDFGTGAIYRRVPARKEMSRDGEWFGMTIVAHGNHLATWVNGVQVTDWYDNRPKSDNARTGCRLEGGHISIQGHDPTTDLSFRNFRIAELK